MGNVGSRKIINEILIIFQMVPRQAPPFDLKKNH